MKYATFLPNLLILSLLLLLATPALSAQTTPAPKGHEHHHDTSLMTEPTMQNLDTRSIYHLDSVWKNQDGKDTPLRSLKDQSLVLAMVYTSCQYVCPVIVSDMKRIEKGLSGEQLKTIKFVVVSFDPKRDTPVALKTFAKKRHLDEDRWILLTGTPDQVLELANALGVKYKQDPNGDFSHSNIIHIVDVAGVVKHQQIGTNIAPGKSLEVLRGF